MNILILFLINAFALFLMGRFVVGVTIPDINTSLNSFLILSVAFTAINMLIKPVLSFLFGPLVFVTLGLFSLVINALMIFLLDYLFPQMTVVGFLPLLYATLILCVVNLLGKGFTKAK
jgi:putative membrane protein